METKEKKSIGSRLTLKQVQPSIKRANTTILNNIDQLIEEYIQIPKDDIAARIEALKIIHQLIFGLT